MRYLDFVLAAVLLNYDRGDHVFRIVVEQTVVRVCARLCERQAKALTRKQRTRIYQRRSIIRRAA
jgi:hypothetical protein